MRYILDHIARITTSYDGTLPLAVNLKAYFKGYPILGSRDRKALANMAYCWFRYKKVAGDHEWLVAGMEYLATVKDKELMTNGHFQEWIQQHVAPDEIATQNVFPYEARLSAGIETSAWKMSLLSQPAIFIRSRLPLAEMEYLLTAAEVLYQTITETCMRVPAGTNLEVLLPPATYVVQDYSSQRVGDYLHTTKNGQWYDCCSGAGGKSLLLKDKEPTISLTVSDIRKSILANLVARFKLYGHEMPLVLPLDVADNAALKRLIGNRRFDNIICDVPCTGSGTWVRTPEQCYFFDPADLGEFVERQKRIATNVIPYLRKGGRLYYITCSVFWEENEGVVQAIVQGGRMKVCNQYLINGIAHEADSMYLCVLECGD